MSPNKAEPSGARRFEMRELLLMASGLVALAGLVFSALLYHDSVSIAAGLRAEMICAPGEKMSCTPALRSEYAHLFGISLTVYGGAFYFAVLALILGVFFGPRERRRDALLASSRFLFLSYLGSVGFSVYLGYVAFVLLPSPCPFCLALYVVNALGFGLACAMKPSLLDFLGDLAGGLRRILTQPASAAFFLVFFVSVGVLHYSQTWAIERTRAASAAQARKEGQAAAAALTGEGDKRISLEGLPMKGNAESKVVFVEFSDFECPFCGEFARSLHRLYEAYPNEIALYFVHYPLGPCNPGFSMHPSACLAALASICAQEKGKFWEFHDRAFQHFAEQREKGDRAELEESDVLAWANALGMQPEEFLLCLNSSETEARLSEQIERAKSLEFRGVPTWTVNAHIRTGIVSFEYLQALVESLLKQQQKP